MTLKFEYTGGDTLPIDASGLTPALLAGSPRSEIERTEIYLANRLIPVAEVFRVSGEASNRWWRFSGDLANVHHLGAKLNRGKLLVEGNIGRHAGSQMTGGALEILGSAGDWVGAEMRGGAIIVRGDAGDNVGAAYRGNKVGMRGGTILIYGSAGHEVGHSMRRGLIAVAGDVGDFVGFHMRAGTILVGGDAGQQAGACMIRGTIALLGSTGELPLNFRRGGAFDSNIVRLLSTDLRLSGFPLSKAIASQPLEIFHGDFFNGGRGELWLRAS